MEQNAMTWLRTILGKKAVKISLGVAAFFVVGWLWQGIQSRLFLTPVVTLIDLRNQQANCDKLAKVTGTVVELIDRQGYVLQQEGITMPVAVGNQVEHRGLPNAGELIHAQVYVTCTNGVPKLVIETSRKW